MSVARPAPDAIGSAVGGAGRTCSTWAAAAARAPAAISAKRQRRWSHNREPGESEIVFMKRGRTLVCGRKNVFLFVTRSWPACLAAGDKASRYRRAECESTALSMNQRIGRVRVEFHPPDLTLALAWPIARRGIVSGPGREKVSSCHQHRDPEHPGLPGELSFPQLLRPDPSFCHDLALADDLLRAGRTRGRL